MFVHTGSGTEELETTDDNAIILIPEDHRKSEGTLVMMNQSGVAGHWRCGSDSTWQIWPSGVKAMFLTDFRTEHQAVEFRRVPGGANVTGLSAFIY